MIIVAGMIHNVGMGNVVDLYDKDPALAGTVWLAIDSVFEGLGGSNEVLGGIWILLISWAALRAGEFPRVLNYLGLAIGVAGIISVVPALAEIFIYIFALGQIVWFVWLGIFMLRSSTSAAAEEPEAFVPRHSTTANLFDFKANGEQEYWRGRLTPDPILRVQHTLQPM